MAADLRAEIQSHIDHLNRADNAALRMHAEREQSTDPLERARLDAETTIENDVWRHHWTWLHTHGIDFKHLDRVGMEWRMSPHIDLVALVEAEAAAKEADRERMRIAPHGGIMSSASL